MHAVVSRTGHTALPEEWNHTRWCDECGRMATQVLTGEQFGCLQEAALDLCDECAFRELARRVKYPPCGICEKCMRFSRLHPVWKWYSMDYSVGMPDLFLCADCKKQEWRIKRELKQDDLLQEELDALVLYETREEFVLFDEKYN